jgi:predicted RecB family nuclease
VRRITGTHVYSFVKCPRLAALDLHLPRSEGRPPHPWEEFAARRGRDFEDELVADMDVAVPQYPERDFDVGFAATTQLLGAGVSWIHQAVLMDDARLGLPDLLRRVPGESRLGDFHYEVIDVKTSGRPRSDQVLQVVFYSRLLAEVQGRMPTHGALILKDRSEERFLLSDFEAVCRDVESELLKLREPGGEALPRARAFLQDGCKSCRWNGRCLPQLEQDQDLSLVPEMTNGVRSILEGLGCETVDDLATFHPEGVRARGHLDSALFRRLRRAAQAVLLRKPILDRTPRGKPLEPMVLVAMLTDPYADRVLAFGALWPGDGDGEDRIEIRIPEDREAEWREFHALLDGLPADGHVLHFGSGLTRWYERHAFAHEASVGIAARCVDLQRRLRSAAVYPAPTFWLEDYVRHGLDRDPDRAGHASAAALWLEEDPDGVRERLQRKLTEDLRDLRALQLRFLADSDAEELAESSRGRKNRRRS